MTEGSGASLPRFESWFSLSSCADSRYFLSLVLSSSYAMVKHMVNVWLMYG